MSAPRLGWTVAIIAACAPSHPPQTSAGVPVYTIDQLDQPPDLERAALTLPPGLARLPCEGRATIDFVIQADGTVDSALTRAVSSNDSIFTRHAIAVLHGTHFSPPQREGQAVPVAARRDFRHEPPDVPVAYDGECFGWLRTAENLGRMDGCYEEPGSRSLERLGRNTWWGHFPATQEHFMAFLRAGQPHDDNLVGIWETRDRFSRVRHYLAGQNLGVPTRVAIVPQCGVEEWAYAAVPVDFHPGHMTRFERLTRRSVLFVLNPTANELAPDIQFFRDDHRLEHSAALEGDFLTVRGGGVGMVTLFRIIDPDTVGVSR